MALSSLVVVLSQLNIYQIYCPVAGWSLVKVICLLPPVSSMFAVLITFLAFATSAQAMPLAPLDQPEGMITQVAKHAARAGTS